MCYAGPVAGAIVTSFIWSKSKNIKVWWLTLLFWGGALFGFIDHLWNKELFLVSANIYNDLLLGAVITVSILCIWAAVVIASKFSPTLVSYLNTQGQK